MRKRTDERRQAILEAAHRTFAEAGFHNTSVDDIARAFGGSKATIYGYFRSKEELFIAVTEEFISGAIMEAFGLLDPDADIVDNLTAFGRCYLGAILRGDIMALRSMVATEGQNSDLAVTFYETGPRRAHANLARVLEVHRRAGRIGLERSDLAAHQLIALIEAEFREARFFGAIPPPDATTIADAVSTALGAFLKIYPLEA